MRSAANRKLTHTTPVEEPRAYGALPCGCWTCLVGCALVNGHSDAVAPPQPHLELEIATPPATTVSVISLSGGASAAPLALDADVLGALPFRTTYARSEEQTS